MKTKLQRSTANHSSGETVVSSGVAILSTSELATALQNMIDYRPFIDVQVKAQNLAALQPSIAMQSGSVRKKFSKVKDAIKSFAQALARDSAMFTEQDARALRASYREALKQTIQELRTEPVAAAANLTASAFTVDKLREKGDKLPDRLSGRFEIITDVPVIITNLFGTKLQEIQKYFRTYDFYDSGYTVVGGQAMLGVSSAYHKQPLSLPIEELLEGLNERHNLNYALVDDKYRQSKTGAGHVRYYWIMRETILTQLANKSIFTTLTEWSILSSKFDDLMAGRALRQPVSKEERLTIEPGLKNTNYKAPKLSVETLVRLFSVLNDIVRSSTEAPSIERLARRVNLNPWFRNNKITVGTELLQAILIDNHQFADTGPLLAAFLELYNNRFRISLHNSTK